VHPTLGILARFQAFFYALSFFESDGVPPPAPARVTNRWALNCDYAAAVLIKIAIWRSEYKNTLIDVLLDKENSNSYSLKINLY
jgi:hypothetical protein